jgi:hypothetical protein
VQAAIGSAAAGLVTAAALSGGIWWLLLIPACLLLMILTGRGNSSARCDQRDIEVGNNLVRSRQ